MEVCSPTIVPADPFGFNATPFAVTVGSCSCLVFVCTWVLNTGLSNGTCCRRTPPSAGPVLDTKKRTHRRRLKYLEEGLRNQNSQRGCRWKGRIYVIVWYLGVDACET